MHSRRSLSPQPDQLRCGMCARKILRREECGHGHMHVPIRKQSVPVPELI
jgi:hypothetical protein